MAASFAFPASARLRTRSEFERVKREGNDSTGRAMRLATFNSGESAMARIGIITSRRVGSAVIRSRVRRRLREICRHHLSELHPGLWVVIVARAAAARASQAELQTEWMRLAERLNIFAKAK